MEIPQLTSEKYERILSGYKNKTPKSKRLYEEAKKHIVPLGVPAYMIWHRPYPLIDGFQKEVRGLTQENDILLIFDEVATAFRVALGGAQELLGITPDITVFGKPVGGGIPIGGVGGSEDIMAVVGVLDPKAERFGPIFPMGSFCAHPLAMAAGIAVIEELEDGDYIKNAILRAEELAKGIREVATNLKLSFSAHTTQAVVHFGLTIKGDISNAIDILDFNQMVRLGLLLSDPGVVTLPGHVYMSGVHTREDIHKCILAFENCLKVYTK